MFFKKILLGSMLLLGCTTSIVTSQFEDILKLAEQGNAQAQYELGMMYGIGDGVKQDTANALVWLLKAAKNGNESAELFLTFLLLIREMQMLKMSLE